MRVNQKKTGFIVVLVLVSLLVVLPIQMAKAQTATVSVSPQNSTASVGKTVTVAIQLSNVQNLYGFDVTLSYDNAVLQLTDSKLDLGTSSIPGGVLYGDPVSTNFVAGGVYYNTSLSTPSDYELIATSVNTAGPFSGNGTIVTLTFTVLSSGQSPLTLNVQLASYPQGSGGVSEPISATVVNGYFATPSTSPSASQTPSSSPTSTPSSSSSASPSPSATSSSLLKSPAFAVLVAIIVVLVIVLVALAVAFSRRRTKKNQASS
jgi:hypothetical protein